eukprot:CAMPEP_0176374426 /NCGR_PEP_ID=MMETSP0126-20121128/26748_1 /TAXON_ID=141414 ORGANISM="Strombidinopsis acuminatum, Strain SPMC142" /NCGR_SAMPLE_ID=MMETSP0126 /ASSEMBLY_ACC=CAM_ASM_000229 /LENGTH=180 /DNA_ID=CAMNT_0017734995 /DNA_START=92 /DNA_END=634 /DNA_ORIENTATION=-
MSTNSDYQSFGEQTANYAPVNPVQFQGDKFTVFCNQTTEQKYVPFEIKEIGMKHGLIYGLVLIWDHLALLGDFTGFAQLYVLGSASYFSMKYMMNSVDRMELHKDGKNVTLHFKIAGQKATVPVKDIVKGKNEKELVTTFEEGYLFPITVGNKTYYLHGRGAESVKNGEVFRAILNGRNI